MAALFTSLPWWQLRPADTLLTEQPGGDDPAHDVSAARTENGDVALLYLPVGGAVTLEPEALPDSLLAEWFDPRTGRRMPAPHEAPGTFRAPDAQDSGATAAEKGDRSGLRTTPISSQTYQCLLSAVADRLA